MWKSWHWYTEPAWAEAVLPGGVKHLLRVSVSLNLAHYIPCSPHISPGPVSKFILLYKPCNSEETNSRECICGDKILLCILNMCICLLLRKYVDNEMSNKFTVKNLLFWTSYNITFSLSLDVYGGIRSLVWW